MDQHPIPQNVTTFQFRLIGDMTIKQFSYLAGGAILAYVCYKLPLPIIITWPLALTLGLLGVGLAFVPIEERPMDIWIMSFIKSIYSPTLFVWQKSAPKPEIGLGMPEATGMKTGYDQFDAIPGLREAMAATESIEALFNKATPKISPAVPVAHRAPTKQPQAGVQSQTPLLDIPVNKSVPPSDNAAPLAWQTALPLGSAPSPPGYALTGYGGEVITIKTHTGLLGLIKKLFHKSPPLPARPTIQTGAVKTSPLAPPTGASINIPLSKPTAPVAPPADESRDELNRAVTKAAELSTMVDKLNKELETKAESEAKILEQQKELAEALAKQESMTRELYDLKHKLAEKQYFSPPPTRVASKTTFQELSPTIRVVTPDVAPKIGLPRLTTFPNVVTGIVKDSDNNLLPGVLITVRDRDGVPLRALKTNKLGQFAASTQLPNGVYMVEVEDPRSRFIFDRAQITINGSVMPPLEIIAKSQKEVSRAKLEKEIFGNQL